MIKRESAIIDNDLPIKKAILEIESHIREIEKDFLLYEEKNFDTRIDAIDLLDFHIIGEIEGLLNKAAQTDKLILLKLRAEKAMGTLEEINANLFKKLRGKICMEKCRGEKFKDLIKEYVDFKISHNNHQEEAGYDNLDVFINGLLPYKAIPEQTKELESEMVYYQKTPARIVFELAESAHFMNNDVFFDLGSGLGQVAILVNLLSGIKVNGVEFEPAFCGYARECAVELNLPDVTFINADAREADYSAGTIFFMYTPFSGKMLQEVLEILRKESLKRKIKIITYGPCTNRVALQSWLNFGNSKADSIYKPCIFTSL